jgi:hypothetical protein
MGVFDSFGLDVIKGSGGGRAGGVGTLGVGGGFGGGGVTPPGGGFDFGDFFKKDGGAGLALGGLATLGSFFDSFQQLNLAKKTLAFQKKAFNTNLKDQRSAFNGALTDKLRSRGFTQGDSQESIDSQIAERRLA